MSTTKTGAALERRRPDLWWSESRLGEAIARLDMADPDEQMSEAQAGEFLAEFVSPQAIVARRDEFAGFILEAEALAAAKMQQSQILQQQADRLVIGASRMKAQAVMLMRGAKVKVLAGEMYTLKLKDSPGAVKINDEAQVPSEFWRVKQDADLTRLERLLTIVRHLSAAVLIETGMEGRNVEEAVEQDELVIEAAGLVEQSKGERRAVNKKAIQDEWKANGEWRTDMDPETGEATDVPMVPGAERVVDTKLVIG